MEQTSGSAVGEMMLETDSTTEFAQFLGDFAHALELAAAGKVDEAEDAISDARRAATGGAGADFTSSMAATYRYDVAARVLAERWGMAPSRQPASGSTAEAGR